MSLRRSGWAFALAAAVLPSTAQPAPDARAEPADLLPDLVQETPGDLQMRLVHGRQLLGFRSAVRNVGDGPLAVAGSRPNRGTRDMRADQLVATAAGARRVPGVGFLRYVTSRDHAHWHLLPFEVYELRREGSGGLVARDRKSGFCLGDRYRVEPRLPTAVPAPVFFTRCGLRRPWLLRIREGISVGWADDYVAYLDGQSIDVTDVPSGRYVLVHTVNRSGRIVEKETTNNSASVRIALTRRTGRVRVRLLPPAG